jgi:hypothetical protein
VLLPSAAYAQAAITGVVKDDSGAVLPGATVEASSPALIEKVRSVISDATGQYRIVDLRPGSYSVTFTLPGFSTVRREGIELTGTFVATVNADLKVGGLEETVTVTGESPVVDVQSATTQQTLSDDLISAVPSSRLAQSVVRLIPGVMAQTDVGGTGGAGIGPQGAGGGLIHGNKAEDSRIMQDGMTQGWNGGGSGMFLANTGGAQEIVASTSGNTAEAEVGGVILNVIPRDGGNLFNGQVFYSFANGAMQGDNYSQELQDRGLRSPSKIKKLQDFNPVGGGPIRKDRLWFYVTARSIIANKTVPGMFANLNAGNVNAWTYEPDLSLPAVETKHAASGSIRLTWQATPRNKFVGHYDAQWRHEGNGPAGVGNTGPCSCPWMFAPEASNVLHNTPGALTQALWNSPLTDRILLEGGFNSWMLTWRFPEPRPGVNPLLYSVVEQGGAFPGITYRVPPTFTQSYINTTTWRASMTYVTGAHNMKFGYFGGYQYPEDTRYVLDCPECAGGDHLVTQYRFNNGVPNQISFQGIPVTTNIRRIIPTSFYAQDQWTTGRLTLQGGLRYDHMITTYPEFRTEPSRLIPTPIVITKDQIRGVNFNDISPRIGVAYDLFGSARTALKFNIGRFPVAQQGSGNLNPSPFQRLVLSSTRSWNDTNRNYVPDCELADLARNGECGPIANQNFGKPVFSLNHDPRTISGWHTRPYQWEMGASVQQELMPRVSATVGYYRRTFGNFNVIDNRATTPADYDPFSIVAPVDPRLPGGGGYPVTDLYDINPAKFGVTDNYLIPSSDLGEQIEYWHGFDVNVVARMTNGLTVQGGTSTGRRVRDDCEIKPDNPSRRHCHIAEPFLTYVRGAASYVIPRLDILISSAINSDVQGANPTTDGAANGLAANWNVPNALVRPSLGRDLAGGAANVTVNLIDPATLYGDRITYVDFRVAKVLRLGRNRVQFGLDVYNILNSNAPQQYNQTYIPNGTWLIPQETLPARFAKVSLEVGF